MSPACAPSLGQSRPWTFTPMYPSTGGVVSAPSILMETGDHLLMETGDRLLLE